jgi:hypothetical protein
MFDPVKAALGEYMVGFFKNIIPTTLPLKNYVIRNAGAAMLWAPARMVDAADQMLAAYQRSDPDGEASTSSKLPVILIALAKDYVPTARDYTRQIADREMVVLPDDPKERLFGLRMASGDLRAQIAIFTSDEPTARSLAAQFSLYIEEADKRRFNATYEFAGIQFSGAVQLESTDIPAIAVQTESKNLTIYAIDLTLHAAVPLLDAPKEGEPNDGKGTGPDDPSGYLLSQTVDVFPTVLPR